MIYHRAERLWEGQTVYIIGGGPSLRGVDLDAYLIDVPVIATNDAYRYACADICVFGDKDWFNLHKDALASFSGKVITTNNGCQAPFLLHMQALGTGLSTRDDALAWNTHTGSLAVNLAFLMGAAKIVLLGYDMQSVDGQTNWHFNPWPPSDDATTNHIRGTIVLADALHRVAPHVQVFTTEFSALTCWPHLLQADLLAAARDGTDIGSDSPALNVGAPTVFLSGEYERLEDEISDACVAAPRFCRVASVYDCFTAGSGPCNTYFAPSTVVVGSLDRLLRHNIAFGALYQPAKSPPMDCRMLQWTGPQPWITTRMGVVLARYEPGTTLFLWSRRASADWVHLNVRHHDVYYNESVLEVGQ